MTRYQPIIDVLIDTGCFERVYFDHDTELPVPYRSIGYRKRSALQEQPGKGRQFHKKWSDICAIQGGELRIIVEEERRPSDQKVREVIEKTARCRYVWVDRESLAFSPDCVLFVLLYDNTQGVTERVIEGKGSLRRVIVCDKGSFKEKYDRYGQ